MPIRKDEVDKKRSIFSKCKECKNDFRKNTWNQKKCGTCIKKKKLTPAERWLKTNHNINNTSKNFKNSWNIRIKNEYH
jgi:hypothetical protein